MNQSTANKAIVDSLPVMESFETLQGEGSYTGQAAYFIRLGGCDVGCTWCDVKESWNADDHTTRSVEELVSEVSQSKAELIVITGGEPLMYDLTYLTEQLRATGKRLHIETSGVYPVTGQWDWICFSPKKFKKPRQEFYYKSDELKVVIYHPSDLNWAEGHAAQMESETELFLQPEWSKRNLMMPLIVDYVKSSPKWRVSLQTHKYLDIP